MMMTRPDETDLEAAFERARAAPPRMPDTLSARILADAAALQPAVPIWRRMLRAIGGPAGLGGVTAAAAAGLWLGIAPPVETVDPLVLIGATPTAAEVEMTELFGFGWYGEEG
jgi:hypothetical protein